MVLLPCSKCCGPCWRCYEFNNTCETITETCRTICTSDGVSSELWKSAFSIKSATVDTDTAIPLLLTGQILSFDDGNPGGTSTHRFYNGADIFGLPTTYSVFTQDPLGTQGIVSLAVLCQPDGSFVFRINVICDPSFNSIVSAKKDGTELPNRTEPADNRTQWTWNSDTVSSLFSYAGTFEFLFADGTSLSITIQESISGGTQYQCFDAPPDEEGWTPIGGKHPDEASCEASCGTTKRSRTMPTTKATTGPGTELANMLAAWGIHAKEKGCGCRKMSRLMDGWGAACATEPHLTTIVDHLQKEAQKRGLPFVRKVGEMLVKRAVRKSQQNS